MKKIILLSFLVYACGVKEKAAETLLESAIEKSTGQSVDLDNISENSQNQSASGSISYNGKAIVTEDTPFNGSVTILKNETGISIGAALGSDDGKQVMLSVSNVSEDFSLPLVAKFGNNITDAPIALCSVLAINENSNAMFETPLPFEGIMTITELNENKIVFQIDAKAGTANDAENKGAWKPYSGIFTLKSPVVIASGIEKEKVFK